MNWSIDNLSPQRACHSSTCTEITETDIKASMLASADYALSMLEESIHDDALYCLFEWSDEQSLLSISVTDHSKTNDGKHTVKVHFKGIKQAAIEEQTETIKFWLRDHLTTSADFMKFSLVAGFSRDGRQTVELM
ncbi:hypothetical protein [Alkalimarinus coralli]|uniref:hypothetical protein n=1 Tax=Alkalimarinus coralli TaxID=2935863 RepID=UPI00202B2CB8|nr:hypothetical protein [Alkalimarinus coralli]